MLIPAGINKFKSWLLNEVGLPKYYETFIKNDIDRLSIVELVTMKELNEIGITSIGHRMKILDEIAKLKNGKKGEIAKIILT